MPSSRHVANASPTAVGGPVRDQGTRTPQRAESAPLASDPPQSESALMRPSRIHEARDDGDWTDLATASGFSCSLLAREAPSVELELRYRRSWLRWTAVAALGVGVTSMLVTAWVAPAGAWTSLRCVRHRLESNSTYHRHEDTDCFLTRRRLFPAFNSPREVNFELANASLRASTKSSGVARYEVWLEGPRLDSTVDDHLWVVTPSHSDARARVARVRAFLARTHVESGLLHLAADESPSVALAVFAVAVLASGASLVWTTPYLETTRISPGPLGLVIVQRQNVLGADLGRLVAVPLADVSCAAVDAVVERDESVLVLGPAGRDRVRSRARRVWRLELRRSSGRGRRESVALLLGDAVQDPDPLHRLANRINAWVLDAHVVDAEDAPQGAGARSRCVVCLQRPVTVAMLPCRHVCACETCGPSLVQAACPMCRARVGDIVTVFVV